MLKNFTLIALAALFITAFTACQKDPESGANPGGTSYFTLGGAPGSCTSPVIAGSYNTGIELTQANTITLTVNVAATGTYNVHTNSNNGVYFLGGGTFTATGPQTITLAGHGTATNTGNFTFVLATFNTCSFPLTFGSGGGGGGSAAVYTYAGAPNACTVANVQGMYASGVMLNAGNFADINVDVATPGTYNITTNSANGFSFAGSGTFTATGIQAVRLTATGTPGATPGTYTFKPTNNGCSFTVNVVPPPPPAMFAYTCPLSPTISGTFAAGTALTPASTIILTVNVTLAGSYSISTTSSTGDNGVTFSASGIFTSTGNKTITLTSTNTPMVAGTFSYTPAGATCEFDVTYTSGPPDFLRCKVNNVLVDFSDNLINSLDQTSTPKIFSTDGDQVGGSDNFVINVTDDANPIAVATYKNLSITNQNKGCQITYFTGGGFPWGSSLTIANSFTVIITGINTVTQKVTGTFFGTVYDMGGIGTNMKTISEGTFSVTY